MTSIDLLTVDQLENAANDLRNSSLVMDVLGRSIGSLVTDTGQVCAVGAVELCTTKYLVKRTNTAGASWLMAWPWHAPNAKDNCDFDSRRARAENALRVLATVIPVQLCDQCDDAETERHLPHGRACPTCLGRYARRDQWETVTHYNDDHCEADELMHRLFELAAERALTAAAEKRSLVAGSRLLVGV